MKYFNRTLRNILAVLLVAVLCVCSFGCGSGDGKKEPEKQTGKKNVTDTSGYYFEFNGTKVYMDQVTSEILDGLGAYVDYFESTSCAFEGLDKEYQYASFTVYTYPDNGADKVLQVVLKDDIITTPEGISIGDSADKVKSKMGEDCEITETSMIYKKSNSKLTFIITDGEVTSIQYRSLNAI